MIFSGNIKGHTEISMVKGFIREDWQKLQIRTREGKYYS